MVNSIWGDMKLKWKIKTKLIKFINRELESGKYKRLSHSYV